MKFKRSLTSETHIDLTSLIDVVFILLLFFMLTTVYSRSSSLLVNLPEANGENVVEAPVRIDILIDRSGSYAVNGRALSGNDLATLKQAIQMLATGDPDQQIAITADAETSHQSVVTAMDAVAQLGYTKLNIATRQSSGATP